MSSFLDRRRGHRLESAGRLYRRGRNYVIWVHGLLFFGGTLFILCNALDYFFLDNGTLFRPVDLIKLSAYTLLSLLGGYLYGLFVWRNLDRILGPASDPSTQPLQ
jgi:hypothetical protein